MKSCQLTLEMSLKSFRDVSDAGIGSTCRRVAENWERLIERAESVSVLLWVSDGNEIFEWRGDLDEELIWASFIGFCNYGRDDIYPEDNRHYRINQAVPYMAHPPAVRFRDLKKIIACLRQVIGDRTGKPVRIGATIDPGPEFAPCRFKVDRHPEVLTPDNRRKVPPMMQFMTHQAVLKADATSYAGFPDGVPEGTSLGAFLGRQFEAAADDLGYDYIWFSNGFGYSHFPWGYRGEAFLGDGFDAEAATVELAKLRAFWEDFRRECPGKTVEVRGTNFSVGMDIASDGCSHEDVARIGGITAPPCNPPWGSRALGMEMCSFLSRMAVPSEHILFRFYLNDPWFVTNAWYDYYNRETFDIYAPMVACRLNATGGVDTPDRLALLTVDTEQGLLLRDEANESTPHFIRALDERADAAPPLVWLYPHEDYHRILHQGRDELGLPFAGDWFVTQAINAGLPLSGVVCGNTFVRLEASDSLADCVYFAPAPRADWCYAGALVRHVRKGGQVFLYGPLDEAPSELLDMLDLELGEELEGDFDPEARFTDDCYERPAQAATADDPFSAALGLQEGDEGDETTLRPLLHRALVSSGGICAITRLPEDPDVRVVVAQGEASRAYAVSRAEPEWNGGRLIWLRGTVHCDPDHHTLEPTWDPPWRVTRTDTWARRLLAEFGWDILQERESGTVRATNLFIKRRDGAFYFVGHATDTTVRTHVRTPFGAPVYAESETAMRDGYAVRSFGKSVYNEVRTFVECTDGTVHCKEMPPPIGKTRHVCISNLADASVIFFPGRNAIESGSLVVRSVIAGKTVVAAEVDAADGCVRLKGCTGALYFEW